jgi:hypothetical protein
MADGAQSFSAPANQAVGKPLRQFFGIGGKQADAFGQFFRGHGVFVQRKAEAAFIDGIVQQAGGQAVIPQVHAGMQLRLQHAIRLLQLLQQIRADGEQVAAGQCQDLPGGAEAGPHHLGGKAVLAQQA